MNSIQRVVILGSGNVATHLARSFLQADITVQQIYSRNIKNARALADELKVPYTSRLDELSDNVDLYIFAVSDSAIPEILAQTSWNGRFLVHTSGSIPANIFQPFTPVYGVLYPFQTFTRDFPIDLTRVPFFIEASDNTCTMLLKQLANKLTTEIYEVDSQTRLFIHLAGVFANNFTNHMLAIAQKILDEHQLPASILNALVEQTFKKASQIGPYRSQTGPAIRRNTEILHKHIQLLESHPEWQKIYTFVSESIQKLYIDGKLQGETKKD